MTEEIYPGEIAITHSESPVVVFPKSDGNVLYRGRPYSVTIRVGGTAEMVMESLQEYDRLAQFEGIEFVDVIQGIPFKPDAPQDKPAEQPAKPKAEGAPAGAEVDSRGNWPGKEIVSQIRYLMHISDRGKEVIELYPEINGEKGKWPEYSIKSGNKATEKQITDLSAAFGPGHDVMNLEYNRPAKVTLKVWAMVGSGKTSKGNFYVNPVKFEVQK